MAYTNEKKGPDTGQSEKHRPSGQSVHGSAGPEISNSMMWDMPFMAGPGMPNSIMREMLDPAEEEAERLSAGITSGTPGSVRKQMGRRLGADFSSVHFHTGPESVRRNEAMGARAYTRGSDVFFGSGGFDPSVGAHELVHTVQQHAVSGTVSQSVLSGTVQMMPKWLERIRNHFRRHKKMEKDEIKPVASEPVPGKNPVPGRSISAPPVAEGVDKAVFAREADTTDVPAAVKSPEPDEPEVVSPIPIKANIAEEGPGSPPPPSGSPSPEPVSSASATPTIDEEELGSPPPPSGSSSPAPATPSPGPDEPTAVKPVEAKTKAAEEEEPPTPSLSATPSLDNEDDDDDDDDDDDEFDADLPDKLEVRNNAGEWMELMPKGTISSGPAPVHPDGQQGIFSRKYQQYYIINDRGQIEVCVDGQWRQARPIEKRAAGNDRGGSKDKDPKETIRRLKAEEAVLSEDDSSESEGEDLEEEDVGLHGKKIPDWAGTGSEDEDLHLPSRTSGRYHPGFSAMGTAKEINSYAGLLNSATGAVNGIDQLEAAGLDALSDFEPGTGPNTYDYNTNEGPVFTGATQLMGAGTALVSTVTGVHDTIRDAANVEAGASKLDAVQSGLDTLSSAGRVLSSGAGFLDTVGAMSPVADFIPGMNIATGSLTAISGSVQAIRGRVAMHKINKEIKALKQRANVRRRREREEAAEAKKRSSGTVSKDRGEVDEGAAPAAAEEAVLEEEGPAGEEADAREDDETPEEKQQNRLWNIFHHGKWISEYNRTAGGMKAGSGLLSVGSGVATLTGAGVAVGAALGAANGALGVGRFAYDKIKKRNIRHRVIAQELGLRDSKDLDKNKILQKYGVSSTKEAFKIIRQERAKYLLDLAGRDALRKDDEDAVAADNVINALGVHRMKDGSYAPGAEGLLAEKLG